MEELRDNRASCSSETTQNNEQTLIVSPTVISPLRFAYPQLNFIAKSDDTLTPPDDNTIIERTSSSTLIDSDSVDADDSKNTSRKRSHATSQKLKGGNVNVSLTARLAKNDLGKHQKKIEQVINELTDAEASSELANKIQRLNETKKTTTKTKSSSWMKFLKQMQNLSEPKNFPQWLKELKGPSESDEDILNKWSSKPEFVTSDKTLDTLWSVKGFKEKVCQKLCHQQSDELLKLIPASKICNYVCDVFKQTTIPKKDTQ